LHQLKFVNSYHILPTTFYLSIYLQKNMASKKSDNRLAYGVTLLVFGCLFLIRQLHIIPAELSNIVFDFKNYLLIIGIIFLLCHSNKNIGFVLIAVGLLFRLSDIIHWTKDISDFIWPVLLITAGALLVFRKK
jgi:uncharacterized membrane protein YadS